jgi:hypothetical protein
LQPTAAAGRTGGETFRGAGCELKLRLMAFRGRRHSDLVGNATLGLLAEYVVAWVLEVAGGVRQECQRCDLETSDGSHIEVKSIAGIQSWHQERPSRIAFRVYRTRAWDRETNRQSRLSLRLGRWEQRNVGVVPDRPLEPKDRDCPRAANARDEEDPISQADCEVAYPGEDATGDAAQ